MKNFNFALVSILCSNLFQKNNRIKEWTFPFLQELTIRLRLILEGTR